MNALRTGKTLGKERRQPPYPIGAELGANSFTLVEVVVAVAVTAFALVTLMGLLSYSLQIVQQSDNYSRLSHVAGQVLAGLNSRPRVRHGACPVHLVVRARGRSLPRYAAQDADDDDAD